MTLRVKPVDQIFDANHQHAVPVTHFKSKYTVMRNVYRTSIKLTFALLLIGQIVNAQVINQRFIAPAVLRQGYTKIIRQAPGGKLYVYGDFNYHGSTQIGNLVRIQPDGLLDPSFTSYRIHGEGSDILDLEVLSNGNVAFVKRAE